MFNLGGIYWEGRGTRQDFSRAVIWWQKAAEHDDPAAQYNLGLAFFLGNGVTQNNAQAVAWLTRANRNGYPDAQAALDLVAHSLASNPSATGLTKESSTTDSTQAEVSQTAKADTAGHTDQQDAESSNQRTAVTGSTIEPSPDAFSDGVSSSNAVDSSDPSIVQPELQAPTSSNNRPDTLAVTGVVPAVDQVQAAEPEVQGGMIVGEQVDVYATEGSLLPVLGTLAADTPVKILRVNGDWTRILIRGGIDVWVFDQFITENDAGARIQGAGVRARSVPSTEQGSTVVGYFKNGDPVTVQSTQGSWKLVTPPPTSLAVWVMSEHVQLLDNSLTDILPSTTQKTDSTDNVTSPISIKDDPPLAARQTATPPTDTQLDLSLIHI